MHILRALLRSLALLATLLLRTSAGAVDPLAAPVIYPDAGGGFHIQFTTPNVFDLSSDWVRHDAQGRLSGQLRTTDYGEIDVYTDIDGTCKTSRGVTTVKQRLLSDGVVGGGDEYSSTSIFKGTMVGYGAGVKLIGTIHTKACLKYDFGPFSKRKVTVCTKSLTTQTTVHDGRWSIRIVFDNVGRDLIGTAIVYVADATEKAKQYETSVEGRLAPDGEANFKLEPVDDNGIGGTIKLRALVSPRNADTPPQLLEVLEVGGKILGQKFAEVY